MNIDVCLSNRIKLLQDQINTQIEKYGFEDYLKLLSISQELDKTINEWTRVTKFQAGK